MFRWHRGAKQFLVRLVAAAIARFML